MASLRNLRSHGASPFVPFHWQRQPLWTLVARHSRWLALYAQNVTLLGAALAMAPALSFVAVAARLAIYSASEVTTDETVQIAALQEEGLLCC